MGVYRNGAVVLTKGYGPRSIEDGRPITPRTTFDLGSVSKQFTGLAVLLLEHRVSLVSDDVDGGLRAPDTAINTVRDLWSTSV